MLMAHSHILLLASASPARRATLDAAGIRHTVLVSDVDEDAVLRAAIEEAGDAELTAAQKVQILACAKARAVAKEVHEQGNPLGVTVVVGCDSMFEMGADVVGKPHTEELARERLHRMSGHAGELYTGHCVIDMAAGAMVGAAVGAASAAAEENSAEACAVSRARVHIAELSDEDIDAYIASGEPLHVAGSFTIDGRGGPFVERIEGDHHGVVGISLPLLRNLLAQLGYGITSFWK